LKSTRQNHKQNLPAEEFAGVTSTASDESSEMQENGDRCSERRGKNKRRGKAGEGKADKKLVVSCEDFDHW